MRLLILMIILLIANIAIKNFDFRPLCSIYAESLLLI